MIMETDVKNSRYYLNRELSWLQFNKRVLQEAVDTSKKQWMGNYFEREIFPVVTPMAVDSSHPFPFLASKSLNIAMLLEKNERDEEMDEENDIDVKTAIVPVPSVLPRIIRLPDVSEANSRHCFVFLDYNSYLCAKFICLWQRAVSAPNNGGTICLACPPWAFKKGRAMMARRRNGQFGHRQIKMKR